MKKLFITLSFLFAFFTSYKANAQCKATIEYLIGDTTNTYQFYSAGSWGFSYKYTWDFGDGSSIVFSEYPIHKYTKKGTYKVTFIVYSTSLKCADTAYATIVADGKNPCNADFTALQDKTNPLKWNFSAIDTLEDSYFWDPYPGSSATKKFNYTFSTKGTYSVQLVVSNSKDHCMDTVIKTIKVVKKCPVTLSYWVTDTMNNYHFLSFVGINNDWTKFSYKWDFGDGNTSSSPSGMYHRYKSSGTYKVCIFTDSSGCKDTACETVVANKKNPCNANFTAVQDKSNPLVWYFEAIDTMKEYYDWGWSRGPKKYTHTFSSAGNNSMSLIVSSKRDHCIDTLIKSINVKKCDADFTINQVSKSSGIYRLKSPYKASSSIKHAWYLSTKTSWTGDSLILNFGSGSGSVTVCHKLIDSINNCSDSVCKRVDYGKTACDSSFTYRVSNDSLYFAYNGGGTKLKWDYGDGTTDTGKTSGIHVYSKASGYYQVCLTTYCAATNRTSKYCVFILAKNKNCKASFSYKADSANPYKINFTNLSPTSSTAKYLWVTDLGTYTSKNLSLTYSKNGNTNVCLILVDSATSCADSMCKTLYIGNAPCDSSFSYRVSNDSLYFAYTGGGTKTKWNYGDGTIDSGYTHGGYVYSKPGNYTVCLTTYCGSTKRTSKYCINITIKPKNCNADFTYKRDSFNTYKYYFTSLSAPSSTMKYIWSFGDGASSYSANPSNIYPKNATPLVYNVCLKISDTATNCFDTMCRDIIVYPPICDSAFSYTIKSDSLYFSYTYNAKTVKYNFGDGKTSTNKTGYHIYSKPGNYKVCLTAYCSSTDSSEYCVNITIKSKCKALFSVALDTTQKFKLYLINKSSNTGSTLYAWDFGDGNYSGKRNPTHKYSKFGKYNVCLLVYDTTINCYSKYCDTLGLDSSGKLLKADAWELVVLEQTVFGVKKIVKSDFKIYPNPANTKVTIDLSNAINTYQKLEILNSNGQVCTTQPIEAGNDIIDIDLEKIARGLYLIKLGNEHGYSYMKLIKN